MSESYAVTKSNLLSLLSSSLDFPISATDIDRLHQLGLLANGKCCPVIAKLAAPKVKKALASHTKLRMDGLSVGKNF